MVLANESYASRDGSLGHPHICACALMHAFAWGYTIKIIPGKKRKSKTRYISQRKRCTNTGHDSVESSSFKSHWFGLGGLSMCWNLLKLRGLERA